MNQALIPRSNLPNQPIIELLSNDRNADSKSGNVQQLHHIRFQKFFVALSGCALQALIDLAYLFIITESPERCGLDPTKDITNLLRTTPTLAAAINLYLSRNFHTPDTATEHHKHSNPPPDQQNTWQVILNNIVHDREWDYNFRLLSLVSFQIGLLAIDFVYPVANYIERDIASNIIGVAGSLLMGLLYYLARYKIFNYQEPNEHSYAVLGKDSWGKYGRVAFNTGSILGPTAYLLYHLLNHDIVSCIAGANFNVQIALSGSIACLSLFILALAIIFTINYWKINNKAAKLQVNFQHEQAVPSTIPDENNIFITINQHNQHECYYRSKNITIKKIINNKTIITWLQRLQSSATAPAASSALAITMSKYLTILQALNNKGHTPTRSADEKTHSNNHPQPADAAALQEFNNNPYNRAMLQNLYSTYFNHEAASLIHSYNNQKIWQRNCWRSGIALGQEMGMIVGTLIATILSATINIHIFTAVAIMFIGYGLGALIMGPCFSWFYQKMMWYFHGSNAKIAALMVQALSASLGILLSAILVFTMQIHLMLACSIILASFSIGKLIARRYFNAADQIIPALITKDYGDIISSTEAESGKITNKEIHLKIQALITETQDLLANNAVLIIKISGKLLHVSFKKKHNVIQYQLHPIHLQGHNNDRLLFTASSNTVQSHNKDQRPHNFDYKFITQEDIQERLVDIFPYIEHDRANVFYTTYKLSRYTSFAGIGLQEIVKTILQHSFHIYIPTVITLPLFMAACSLIGWSIGIIQLKSLNQQEGIEYENNNPKSISWVEQMDWEMFPGSVFGGFLFGIILGPIFAQFLPLSTLVTMILFTKIGCSAGALLHPWLQAYYGQIAEYFTKSSNNQYAKVSLAAQDSAVTALTP